MASARVGILDPAVPVVEGQLAGQDSGAVAGTVVDHVQQVMPRPFLQRGKRPVVQH